MTPLVTANATKRYLKFVVIDDGCWGWRGPTHDGYAAFSDNTRHWRAHRYSWLLMNGTIPDGRLVCHRCDNRICTNPAHLFLGTYEDNRQDFLNKRSGNHELPTEYIVHQRALAATTVGELSGVLDDMHVQWHTLSDQDRLMKIGVMLRSFRQLFRKLKVISQPLALQIAPVARQEVTQEKQKIE